MTESETSERELPQPGFVPAPFWGDAALTAPPADAYAAGAAPDQADSHEIDAAEVGPHVARGDGDAEGSDAQGPDAGGREAADGAPDDAAPDDAAPDDAEHEESDAEVDAEVEAEADAEADREPSARFEELVGERLHHVRYAHPLTRAVFTPEESIFAELVERRAAVWVPTMTFVVTAVSAIAAVVLATRLRTDPSDPGSAQLVLVTVTVCLVAAAFVTLVRAEMHYQRIRPRGRVVRHDVADAYEIVRDAPRRLLEHGASTDALRRVADLLPVAEQLVDVLAAYQEHGGTRVKAHPAYEQVTRMRAEVEALELLVEEQAAEARANEGAGAAEGATPPRAGQTPTFEGLADIAAALTAQS